ncbi:MAG: rhodanese-like domain-containing protein [Chloroflexi bacterium]|nr:rhodanese-like domain-containing protein [Chloroflexota bacterium]
MPTNIDRDDVQRLMREGAQLIEVLPPTEYEEMHLPGAMNIPLKRRLRSARRYVRATLQDSATSGSAS